MIENNFVGLWGLIPELCLYQQGEVPVSGDYRISCEGDSVIIVVQWIEADSRHGKESKESKESTGGIENQDSTEHKPQLASYGGPIDGSKQVVEIPGITHINFTRIDANTLDSGAFNEEKEIMYARRVISAAGDLMSTVQTTHTEQGSITNFQVYRRCHS